MDKLNAESLFKAIVRFGAIYCGIFTFFVKLKVFDVWMTCSHICDLEWCFSKCVALELDFTYIFPTIIFWSLVLASVITVVFEVVEMGGDISD